jgi:YHS domain-containing protein
VSRNISLLPVLALALAGSPVLAAAQQVPDAIINNDGVGFSRMVDGQLVAYDLVAAYDDHAIVEADCSAFKAKVQGVSWCFSSAANAQTFEAATQENGRNHYLPFVGGHCAMGMSVGNLRARGDPRTALRIGNQLVLNGNFDVRTNFLQDTERNMDNARLRYELAIAAGTLRDKD